ncbi:MAG: response regulator [Spirochaetaceae bacterium]|jgi:signal transduction histidine kinase/DNA-binding response OmpR family regulator|nr:response regulator [Spirochaetaceae bacterium]
MIDTEDAASLKAEIKRLELELKKAIRQLSAAESQIERFSSVNTMQHDVVGVLKTEMSRQEKFMTMLLKYSKNTILLLDMNLDIAYYTDNFFKEMVGGAPSDIEGKNVYAVFETYFDSAMTGEIKRVIADAVSLKETQIMKASVRAGDGEEMLYYVYITAVFYDSGKLEGVILLYTNITELENARIKAEQASKIKSEFLANMSHEIRTPMNTIIGMSDLMPEENLNTLQKSYFSDIKRMSKILLGIINNILDFSKAESGKLELMPVHFNFHLLFQNICSMQSFIAKQKSIGFKSSYMPSVPEFIFADEMRLNQIFINLITNAIKYTRQGFVSFELDTGKLPGGADDKDYLVAKISDTGIGIKKETLPQLFEKFQQLDSRTNAGIEGTGLGLAIVKQLVALMNGAIAVESEYGKGSVFTLHIPIVLGDPSKVEKPIGKQRFIVTEGVRALVVDDVPANLTVASAFLGRFHIESDLAEDGQAAIDKATKALDDNAPYDIIFMDHMMPNMDGIEASRYIRELEKSRQDKNGEPRITPIICLSANAVNGAEEFFISSGMDGFIAKPIEMPALNWVLQKFLPEEKYTFIDTKNDGANKIDKREAQLRKELEGINGLDIQQGLHYVADNFETYVSTLKQFSSGIKKGLAVIRESLAAEDWQTYTIQVHAYKGICATIGALELSEWGKNLEAASKTDDKSLCLAETEDYCTAFETFNTVLMETSLFSETETETIDIPASDMAAKIRELTEACKEGRSARVKAAVKNLESVSFADADSEFKYAMAEILSLSRSLDYEDVVEKAGAILLKLDQSNTR